MQLVSKVSLPVALAVCCNFMGGFRGGGFLGLQPGQKHSIEYSTTEVPSHAGALVCIAKSLVVCSSGQF